MPRTALACLREAEAASLRRRQACLREAEAASLRRRQACLREAEAASLRRRQGGKPGRFSDVGELILCTPAPFPRQGSA
jgi:hypothetical protein